MAARCCWATTSLGTTLSRSPKTAFNYVTGRAIAGAMRTPHNRLHTQRDDSLRMVEAWCCLVLL